MKIFDMDGKIKLLCLIYFMVAQSSMMARATSDSFLLKYFEVESIPLMIMAAASLSIVLAIFTTYLCGRFQAYGAMKIATAGLVVSLGAVIALVFLFGERGETKLIYVFAYMLCEVIVILPMVLFWGMAVGVLNPTESKKWMGMIGAAGTCGCILAGYTISFVSKQQYVNELSLGLVAVVLLVVSFILLLRSKSLTIEDDSSVATQSSSILRKLAVLISSRQSVLMTGLVVFSAIVISLIDINFKFEVREYFDAKPRAELYDFFGQFYTYTSIAQLILQLLVVRAVLTRGGVWAAISILPVLLLLTSVFALMMGGENTVYVSKFITQVVFFTIEYVGLQMLFLSVTKKMRGQMNSAVDGLTRPATIAAISLLITSTLPFWQEDSVFRLNSIIICLCCVWLFVSFLNYRQYLSSLLQNLKAKRIPLTPVKSILSKEEEHSLKESYSSSSDEEILGITDLLCRGKIKGWDDQFRGLLDRADEKFVFPAIRYLGEYGKAEDFDRMLDKVPNGSKDLKIEVLRACSLGSSEENLLKLAYLLDDEDAKVRFCCAALLRSFEHAEKTKADTVCAEFLDSEALADRLLVIDALTCLEGLENSFFVKKLLNLDDGGLNHRAVQLTNEKSVVSLYQELSNRLGGGNDDSGVADCFKRLGQPMGKLLEQDLASREYEESKNRFIELLIALIHSSHPMKWNDFSRYLSKISEGSGRVRVVWEYFDSIKDSPSSPKLRRNAKKEFRQMVREAFSSKVLLGDLPEDRKFDPLRLAVENQLQMRLKVLPLLLSVLDGEIDYSKLIALLKSKEANVKAEALEVLKGVLGPKLTDDFVSLFQLPGSASPTELKILIESLQAHDSRWILSGLLLALSEDDFPNHEGFVKKCLAHDDDLVRETALHVYVCLQKEDEFVEQQCRLLSADPSPYVAKIAYDRLSLN